MWAMYAEGATLRQIAEKWILSRQRVSQILTAAGYPLRPRGRG